MASTFGIPETLTEAGKLAMEYIPSLTSLVTEHEAHVEAFLAARPYGISLFTFLVALNNALLIRRALVHPVGWLRAFLTLFLMTVGGATLSRMLLGHPALWLAPEAGVLEAALAAYVLTFHVLGSLSDWVVRFLGFGLFRPLWAAVATLQAVVGASAGVEAVRALHSSGGGASHFFALQLLLGVLWANGGTLLTELLNTLALPRDVLAAPRLGASPAAYAALLATVLYAGVFTASVPVDAAACVAGLRAVLPAALLPPAAPLLDAVLGFTGETFTWGLGLGPAAGRAALAGALLAPLVVFGVGSAGTAINAILRAVCARPVIPPMLPAAGAPDRVSFLVSPPPFPLQGGVLGYRLGSLSELLTPAERQNIAAAQAQAQAAAQAEARTRREDSSAGAGSKRAAAPLADVAAAREPAPAQGVGKRGAAPIDGPVPPAGSRAGGPATPGAPSSPAGLRRRNK